MESEGWLRLSIVMPGVRESLWTCIQFDRSWSSWGHLRSTCPSQCNECAWYRHGSPDVYLIDDCRFVYVLCTGCWTSYAAGHVCDTSSGRHFCDWSFKARHGTQLPATQPLRIACLTCSALVMCSTRLLTLAIEGEAWDTHHSYVRAYLTHNVLLIGWRPRVVGRTLPSPGCCWPNLQTGHPIN